MTSKKVPKQKIKKNKELKNKYYDELWSRHRKGFVKDHVPLFASQDLVDYYIVPSISNDETKELTSPFESAPFRNLVLASSGLGKSTLLHIMLLCCLIDKNICSDCPTILADLKEKKETYENIKKSLFGKSSICFFPVYIDSNEANNVEYNSLLDLADSKPEEKDNSLFSEMIEEANKNGNLLFLIDSIDEVESTQINKYCFLLKKLLDDYDNASYIITSRLSGKKAYPFAYTKLFINELRNDGIPVIAFSLLHKDKATSFIDFYKKNEHLTTLLVMPSALLSLLEPTGEYHFNQMIEHAVISTISRRWLKHSSTISKDNMILLLGFLASAYIFGNKEHADSTEISQIFNTAKDNLTMKQVPFVFPKERLDYFLGTLSTQSGLLDTEIINGKEEYSFPNDLVACWLSANYIYNAMSQTKEVSEDSSIHGIWANTCWLDDFVRSFSTENQNSLSKYAISTLIMALVMTSGHDRQKIYLLYLVFRDAISVDITEQYNIAKGYQALINNKFGENDLANLPEGDVRKIINRMVNSNNFPDFLIIQKGDN